MHASRAIGIFIGVAFWGPKQDALDVTMKMALGVPLADVMAYRKLGKAFFGLLDVLCGAHTHVIAACDTPTFAFLITALDAGLKSLDVVVSSQCAAAVDNLAGFYFKAVQANSGETPSPTAQVLVLFVFCPCLEPDIDLA